MEKKNSKNKLLTTAVIAILCIIFVVGFVYGLNKVLAMEGAFPPSDNVEGLTKAPETKAQAIAFLNDVYEKAVSEKPKFSNGRSYEIDGDSIETSLSPGFVSSCLFVNDNFCAALNGDFESAETDFGEDFSKIALKPDYSAKDVIDFECNYIYYVCPSCGETSDEPKDSHPECGSGYPYQMKYRDEYEIILHLKADAGKLDKKELEEAKANAVKGFGDCAKITDIKTDYDALTLTFKVNRLTNELKSLKYTKDFTVSFNFAGNGDFSEVGNGDVSFKLVQNKSFDFTWPSLELSAKEMVIEPKGNDNLLATLTCTDPLKCTVSWESSDENVVTVDEEGYLKAAKTPGEADVKASFEFNGKVYTDVCKVLVRIPVESLAMTKRSAKIGVGDTLQLKTKTDPSNATVQSVKWYTEDESIASVDENGLVTANKAGVVKVYALSDDGFFKSSCEVTVK